MRCGRLSKFFDYLLLLLWSTASSSSNRESVSWVCPGWSGSWSSQSVVIFVLRQVPVSYRRQDAPTSTSPDDEWTTTSRCVEDRRGAASGPRPSAWWRCLSPPSTCSDTRLQCAASGTRKVSLGSHFCEARNNSVNEMTWVRRIQSLMRCAVVLATCSSDVWRMSVKQPVLTAQFRNF